MTEVKEIMRENVETIDAERTVLEAAEFMDDHDSDYLVVEEDEGIAGLITEGDMVSKVLVRRKDPSSVKVHEIMSSPLETIHPLSSLEDAAEKFNETGVRRLIVSSGEYLEGVVSTEDIVTAETRFIKVLERYIHLLQSQGCK